MIQELTIRNFKAIGAEQRIPLRPITLLFGPNSSGKSTVIHALLLLKHILATASWTHSAWAAARNPWTLGGFPSQA